MGFIIAALKIIIVLGTLITIHELGHFLVSKACGVKVHKFAIGFGPKIFCKQGKETEYTIRAIPFGGFVQLEGEEERSDDPRAFNNKPIWQRMLIIVAGATINILFALLVYYLICVTCNLYITSRISNIVETSPLYEVGIRIGDEITSINGKKTITNIHVEDIIAKSKSDDFIFEIKRDNDDFKIPVNIPKTEIGMVGISFNNDGTVAYVQKGSAADGVGITADSKLISINDIDGITVSEFIDIIKKNPNNEIQMKFEINGDIKEYTVIPESKAVRIPGISYKVETDMNFFDNSYYALDETGYYFNSNIEGLWQLLTGKNKEVEVMGVVGVAGEIADTEGIAQFFALMSAISLSLGLFNLLPIPALDGGKLLLLIIEAIRGKPLKEKTEIRVQLIGFSAIMLFALWVTICDVIKLF